MVIMGKEISQEGWNMVSEKIARDEERLRRLHDSPEMRAFRFRESVLIAVIKNKK
jgi:hypothetical protein